MFFFILIISFFVSCGSSGKKNHKPEVSSQTFTTNKNTLFYFVVKAKDDAKNTLNYKIVYEPVYGSFIGNYKEGLPYLIYQPKVDFVGEDFFMFKVNDGKVDSDIAVVTIKVLDGNSSVGIGENHKPIASSQTLSIKRNAQKTITLSGSDEDKDTLIYSLISNTSNKGGTLVLKQNKVTYTPKINFSGTDIFMFKVNDGKVDSNIAIVIINVESNSYSVNTGGGGGSSSGGTTSSSSGGSASVNHKPIADSQSLSVNEDTNKTITLNGSDADNDTLSYILDSNTSNKGGTLVLNQNKVIYTPALNFNGSDTFKFKVNDGTLDSDKATVTITVNALNDKPLASSQSVNTTEDVDVNITLSGTDVDGDTISYTVISNPTHGTLSGTAPDLTYSPNVNYNGNDSFTFKVNDGNLDSNESTITIIIASDGIEEIVHNGFDYEVITSPITGKKWLDRNLGADVRCTKSRNEFASSPEYITDQKDCFGDLYQWGRLNDGHEKINYTDTSQNQAVSYSDDYTIDDGGIIKTTGAESDKFIKKSASNNDWTNKDLDKSKREVQWIKTDGTFICPAGFRVPSIEELKAETTDYAGIEDEASGKVKVINNITAFKNFLKFPSPGFRHDSTSNIRYRGEYLFPVFLAKKK